MIKSTSMALFACCLLANSPVFAQMSLGVQDNGFANSPQNGRSDSPPQFHPAIALHKAALDYITNTIAPLALSSSGELDAGFGSAGKVTTSFGIVEDTPMGMVVQMDGKIVVAGNNGSDFALVRYNADGSLDGGFGTGGRLATDFAGYTDYVYAVKQQADGKLVASGMAAVNPTTGVFAVARYLSNGTLDSSFGVGGKVMIDFAGTSVDHAYALGIQSDGRIVVGGYVGSGFPTANFGLARLDSNGSLDTSFGSDGIVVTDFGAHDSIAALIIQPDGKIVAGGLTSYGSPRFGLARYNSNGTLDTSFDGDGKVSTLFPGANSQAIYGMAAQPDGKILAVGYVDFSYFGQNDIAVARYNLDGSLDSDFDGDGMASTDFIGRHDQARSVVVAPSGKILIGGWTTNGNGDRDFALVQYNSDGSLDSTFGSAGKIATPINADEDVGYAVALQSDGKAVLAGRTVVGGTSSFAVARYLVGSIRTTIDVKPGAADNPINLTSKGVIPVVLFSTSTFDPFTVAIESVRFAGARVDGGSIDDVDGDGQLDLIFHFRTQDTNLKAAYGTSLSAADTIDDGRLDPGVSTRQSISVTLTGETTTGQKFEGTDLVLLFLEGKPLRDFLTMLAGI